MAFEMRTCLSFPWAQSLYTVDVQTRSRFAASRTEKSLGQAPARESDDCNPGVTRSLSNSPKCDQNSVGAAALLPVVPAGCEVLPGSATPASLPVTPETGSTPSCLSSTTSRSFTAEPVLKLGAAMASAMSTFLGHRTIATTKRFYATHATPKNPLIIPPKAKKKKRARRKARRSA